MPFSFSRRGSALGISVSDGSIECLEAVPASRGSFSVRARSRTELAPGIIQRGVIQEEDKLVAALAEALAGSPVPFKEEAVCVALPDLVTYVHLFRFSGSLADREVGNALAFQSEEVLPFPPEEAVADFLVVERTGEATVAIAAFAPRAVVEGYARAFARAGLKGARLIPETQALGRAFAEPEEGKATIVADVGGAATAFSVHDAFGVRATFSVPSGGDDVTRALMGGKKPLARTAAEALKRKDPPPPAVQKAHAALASALAKRCAGVVSWYAAAGGTVEGIVLTGGTSASRAFQSAFAAAPGLPDVDLRVGIIAASGADGAFDEEDSALFGPAYGAAVAALGPEPAFDFASAAGRPRLSARTAVLAAVPRAGQQAVPDAAKATFKERLADLTQRQKLVAVAAFLILAIGALGTALYLRMSAERDIDAQVAALRARGNAAPGQEETAVSRRVVSIAPGEGEIQAWKVAVTKEVVVPADVATFAATDGVARGTVTLVNASATPAPLVATTRLLSAEGVLFRLETAVTVPAGGEIEAQAHADQPGETGDIGPATFTIPGLPSARQAEVTGRSDAPMTGGVAYAATPEALEAARAQALADADVPALFAGQLAEGQVAVPELTAFSAEAKEATKEGILVVLTATTLAILEADLSGGEIMEGSGLDIEAGRATVEIGATDYPHDP